MDKLKLTKDEEDFYNGIDCMYSNYFKPNKRLTGKLITIEKKIRELQAEKNKIISELKSK